MSQKTITYEQMADYNPYMHSSELEASLTRNQRDVLDYFIMCYNSEEINIYILVDFLKYITQFQSLPTPSDDDCLEICRMYSAQK